MGMDNNMIWIASIFIAGLGQILMGDLWRGLKFTLIVYGIGIVGSVLAGILVAVLVAGGGVGLALDFNNNWSCCLGSSFNILMYLT